MIDKFVSELDNFITANRYVNLHSKRFSVEEEGNRNLQHFRSKFAEKCGNLLIDIDVKAFETCEEAEEEAAIILELINKALKKHGFKDSISDAISVTGALEKLSAKLDRRALVVFHFFCDIFDEKEKDIFRAIRKFIEIFEKSRYLGILIISDKPVHHWELYPESKLDDRHVAYKEYP